MAVLDASFTPVGTHGQYTAGNMDTVQTIAIPSGATKVYLQATAQNARVTLDGTAATATKGFRLVATAQPTLFPVTKATSLQVISETAGAALDYLFGT